MITITRASARGWRIEHAGRVDVTPDDPEAVACVVRRIVAELAVFSAAGTPRTPAPCSLPLPGPIPADFSGPLTAGDDPAGS